MKMIKTFNIAIVVVLVSLHFAQSRYVLISKQINKEVKAESMTSYHRSYWKFHFLTFRILSEQELNNTALDNDESSYRRML